MLIVNLGILYWDENCMACFKWDGILEHFGDEWAFFLGTALTNNFIIFVTVIIWIMDLLRNINAFTHRITVNFGSGASG